MTRSGKIARSWKNLSGQFVDPVVIEIVPAQHFIRRGVSSGLLRQEPTKEAALCNPYLSLKIGFRRLAAEVKPCILCYSLAFFEWV